MEIELLPILQMIPVAMPVAQVSPNPTQANQVRLNSEMNFTPWFCNAFCKCYL